MFESEYLCIQREAEKVLEREYEDYMISPPLEGENQT